MARSKAQLSVALILLVNVFLTSMVSARSHTCEKDAMKFGACTEVLVDLVGLVIGKRHKSEACCTALEGLRSVEDAKCLCKAIKANVLGAAFLDRGVAFAMLFNRCGKDIPSGFNCA